MSASRTLLNKQGRRPGPLSQMRAHFPRSRGARMSTPHSSVSLSNVDRIRMFVWDKAFTTKQGYLA